MPRRARRAAPHPNHQKSAAVGKVVPDGDEEATPNEEILSAFRARRNRPGDAAPAVTPGGPTHNKGPAPAGLAPPGSAAAQAAAGAPQGAPAQLTPWDRSEARAGEARGEPLPHGSADGGEVIEATMRPHPQAALAIGHPSGPAALSSPAPPPMRPGSPLTAASPNLRLSDRLLADRNLTVRGSPAGRLAGAIVAVAGAALLLAERALYAVRDADAVYLTEAGPSLFAVAVGILLVGLAVWGAFTLLPRGRRLTVRLAETQVQEWDRVQGEVRAMRGRMWLGAGLALLGMALALASLQRLGASGLVPALAGVLVLVAGVALLVWAQGRRGVLQRLYVQTLVLSSLERAGVSPGGPDARVAPVLRALDHLLGALPESAVRAFLSSPEASQYLELIDELGAPAGSTASGAGDAEPRPGQGQGR